MLSQTVVCAILSGTEKQLNLNFGGSDSESGKRALRRQDLKDRNDPRVDANRASESSTSSDQSASLREAVSEGVSWTKPEAMKLSTSGEQRELICANSRCRLIRWQQ